MTDLNDKILKAIANDQFDRPLPEADATAIGLIRSSFKGTFRYTMIFIIVLQLCFAGLGIYCALQMFDVVAVGSKIEWLSGLLIAVIAFSIARLWFFMELNRLSILREMKRMEMQIAFLSDKIQSFEEQ
jgi:hypothetical protein